MEVSAAQDVSVLSEDVQQQVQLEAGLEIFMFFRRNSNSTIINVRLSGNKPLKQLKMNHPTFSITTFTTTLITILSKFKQAKKP